MSWKATAWAKDQEAGDVSAKCVLLLLADYCPDPDLEASPPRVDFRAWVSIGRLAREAEMHPGTAQRALRRLEERELVAKIARPGKTSYYVLPVGTVIHSHSDLRGVESGTPRDLRDHPAHPRATTPRTGALRTTKEPGGNHKSRAESVVPHVPGAGNPVRSSSLCPECEGRGVADELTADGTAQPCPTCNTDGW